MAIKKIGVLTSGGDAPGMNAAIRAVVRTALYNDIDVVGIKRGYEGLLNAFRYNGSIDSENIINMTPRSVSDIIQRGGTILLTARSEEMRTPEGQDKAAKNCKDLELDALVVIGGDGSLHGGAELIRRGVNVIGLPGTIDLDLVCSEYTIGFDTAVNTAMEAIGKIRDTSGSHERCSIVEVMGRNAGYIALWCGLTGGAEEALIPEDSATNNHEELEELIQRNRKKGKTHNLIVVAEGIGNSVKMAKEIEGRIGIETRATILGYLQRGGSPTALDRLHASVMGYMAVDVLLQGKQNRVIVVKNGKDVDIDLEEGLNEQRVYDPTMYNILKTLSV
ncbi:ATP-dependent 6-phosphofructokinase [Clostridia bacterium]|nr:ATP-dependent 6-phosphofructokinase [Clostridia bacterium]